MFRQRSAVTSPARMRAELEHIVNSHRFSLDLPRLEPNSILAAAALQHAQRMRNLGFFGHVDPHDHTGPGDRVRAIDEGHWRVLAENLAAGQQGAGQVLEGWLASRAHSANLELLEITRVGTGIVTGGALRTYTVQIYGDDLRTIDLSLSRILPMPSDLFVRVIRHPRERRWP